MKIKDYPNEKLKEEYRCIHSMIHNDECFGTRDLIYFEDLSNELKRRKIGVKIISDVEFLEGFNYDSSEDDE